MGLTRLSTVVLLFVPLALFGQQTEAPQPSKEPAATAQNTQEPRTLARLSYRSTDGTPESICLSVANDGTYQMVRTPPLGGVERMRGKLPEKDRDTLKAMISDPGLRRLPENRGGIIRSRAETFNAEFPSSTPSQPGIYPDGWAGQRVLWQNADGENPFPSPIEKIVNWLRNFDAAGGKPFEYAEMEQVCPSQGLSYIRPSVAENTEPR